MKPPTLQTGEYGYLSVFIAFSISSMEGRIEWFDE
jgi:hypothetical protein